VSEENLELVRQHYAAWSSGDLTGATRLFADDVEWHGHPRLPEPGPYGSREEVKRWMSQFQEAWGELEADPVILVEEGDNVIALVHMSGRGRDSGVEVRGGVDVHVMSFRDDALSYFCIHPGDYLREHSEVSDAEFELLVLLVQEGLETPDAARRLGIDRSEAERMLGHVEELLKQLARSERVS
jgi:ketosteroid isomerase-like protein